MNGKIGGNPLLRRAGALAVVAAVAVLTTACGVVHINFGPASAKSATFQPNLAFVRCMHSHGLTNFPNPKPSKSVTVRLDGNSPAARSYDACKHLLP